MHQNASEGWCITAGQVISTPQCEHSMVPHYRSCYDGVKPQPKGGNPLGCGWQFASPVGSGSGVIRSLSCTGAMTGYCLGYDSEHTVRLYSIVKPAFVS